MSIKQQHIMDSDKKSSGRKSDRHCFVPHCRSGYKNNPIKKTLFSVPRDPETFLKWKAMIPRADRTLENHHAVCEKHFKEDYIERHYRHTINGEEVLMLRDKPKLIAGALPTEYPDLPPIFSKTVPKKRKAPKTRTFLPSKRLKCGEEPLNDIQSSPQNIDPKLPSQYWTKIQLKNDNNVLVFALWTELEVNATNGLNLKPERLVVVHTDNGTYSVYISGCNVITDKAFDSQADLESIIEDVDAKTLCKGSGTVEEFSGLSCSGLQVQGNRLRHKLCKGYVDSAPKLTCLYCKCARKQMLDRRHKDKKKLPQKRCSTTLYRKSYLIKSKQCLKTKVKNLKKTMCLIKKSMKTISERAVENKVNSLPFKQALAISHCMKASNRKSSRGMAYSREWLLESILMKMKSPRLYQHMRINKILTLPGKTCLKKSIKHFKSGFGFNEKVFSILKEKTSSMETSEKHGNLLFDELKLSENLQMDSSGVVQGYVDYGQELTPDSQMNQICNHGLVLLFQPFKGDWVQIVGVFGTHQNVKADLLAKILVEAIILCENAGLFVDAVTGDGASWNRAMWRRFGIGQSKRGIVKYKVAHPCDSGRFLHFISDFPHLLKCLRNRFLSQGYSTPAGKVNMEFVKEAWKEDQKSTIKLKVMPKLSQVHLHPNGFEKMRVNIAFQLFGDPVIKGLSFYSEEISVYGDSKPTVDFIQKINQLIKVMTSRTPKTALRNGSLQYKALTDFIKFINEWEKFSKPVKGLGYLSKSTALGLKVSIKSTLSLLSYLSSKINFKYLLTSRLSQDKIENLFSIVRQSKGCNDHPTPTEFLTIIECLTFYNLAHAPKSGNVGASVVSALVSPDQQHNSPKQILQTLLDELVEGGKFTDACDILKDSTSMLNLAVQHSDSRLIYYTSGYIVRKFFKITKCDDCRGLLSSNKDDVNIEESDYTKQFDLGGLMYPSKQLFEFVCILENHFTESLSVNGLHRDITLEIVDELKRANIPIIGCNLHNKDLTKKLVQFYILTRMHFHLKSNNKFTEQKRKRLKALKLRRTN